jgi:hypothetical protein
MKLKKLYLLLFFIPFSNFSFTQERSEDYGTFVLYKNPKYIQQFTNERFQEIKTTVESKRQEHTEVRWDITEYTYVIIKSKDEISSGTVKPESTNQTEGE